MDASFKFLSAQLGKPALDLIDPGGRRRREMHMPVRAPRQPCFNFFGLVRRVVNLANFMRTLALPEEVEHWSLTTLWEKLVKLREELVKIGAKVVRHGRYVTF